MIKYLFVGIGAFAGAITRHWILSSQLFDSTGSFPVKTWLINVLGSFLLTFILTLTLYKIHLDIDVRHGMTAGFLGAFTTFSTFSKEIAGMLHAGNYLYALSYVSASVIFGLLAAYLGFLLAEFAGGRFFTRNEIADDIDVMEEDLE